MTAARPPGCGAHTRRTSACTDTRPSARTPESARRIARRARRPSTRSRRRRHAGAQLRDRERRRGGPGPARAHPGTGSGGDGRAADRPGRGRCHRDRSHARSGRRRCRSAARSCPRAPHPPRRSARAGARRFAIGPLNRTVLLSHWRRVPSPLTATARLRTRHRPRRRHPTGAVCCEQVRGRLGGDLLPPLPFPTS